MVDARQRPELVAELKARGYDLNDGMALIDGGRVWQGREAVAALNGMGEAGGLAGRAARTLMRLPGFLRAVYPGMKLARLIVLRILGRDTRISA